MIRGLRKSEMCERKSLDSFRQTIGSNMDTIVLLVRAQKEVSPYHFREHLNYHKKNS